MLKQNPRKKTFLIERNFKVGNKYTVQSAATLTIGKIKNKTASRAYTQCKRDFTTV
jgi:hypothetical protein